MYSFPTTGTAYSYNLEKFGLDSTWFVANSSSIVWIYTLHAAVFLTVFLLVKEVNRCTGRLASTVRRLNEYFFFNGLTRLLMETFLEI